MGLDYPPKLVWAKVRGEVFLVIFLSVKTTSCTIAARQVVEFSAQSVAVSNTGNGRHVEGVLELLREYELAG